MHMFAHPQAAQQNSSWRSSRQKAMKSEQGRHYGPDSVQWIKAAAAQRLCRGGSCVCSLRASQQQTLPSGVCTHRQAGAPDGETGLAGRGGSTAAAAAAASMTGSRRAGGEGEGYRLPNGVRVRTSAGGHACRHARASVPGRAREGDMHKQAPAYANAQPCLALGCTHMVCQGHSEICHCRVCKQCDMPVPCVQAARFASAVCASK